MKPIQVSQLNKYIKTVLQSDPLLSKLSIVGEVSNLKFHGSGHVYFSLKDRMSRINCFLAADKVQFLNYPLEEGLEIIASGYIYLYEKGGSYSLNVQDIQVEGEGNLATAFERLKQKLEKEGLFDPQIKKPLPRFPSAVGIVTSGSGAAVWDVIKTIRKKNKHVDIILCPCKVQGDGAAADIEDAIDALNRMKNPPDVMIVGRGGGSSEELWAFNEERVARSIFRSQIPVISAVGHETDFTIADFAADYRAATPTAAAEAAVPDIEELKSGIEYIKNEMLSEVERKLVYLENSLEMYPKNNLIAGFEGKIELFGKKSEGLMKDIVLTFKEKLHEEELKIEKLKSRVDSMNPERIMEMGFGVVSDKGGRYIKSAAELKEGGNINVELKDGRLSCIVEAVYRKSI